MWFLVAAVAIVAIVGAVVIYTIKHLSSTPVRIAAVIIAITGLVAALPKVINSLRPEPRPLDAPAPVTPGPRVPAPSAPAPSHLVPSGPADIPSAPSPTAATEAS